MKWHNPIASLWALLAGKSGQNSRVRGRETVVAVLRREESVPARKRWIGINGRAKRRIINNRKG